MDKALLTMSGGMDSLAIVLDYMEKLGPENIITLGFNYGQRHFEKENEAATRFCNKHGIERVVLDVPIRQIGGCSLVDHSIPVTENMEDQRSTVVPNRNMIFMSLAAAVAQVRGCNIITHGACAEDAPAYRDCRSIFFKYINMAIQAAITNPINGSEDIREDLQTSVQVCNTKATVIHNILPENMDIRIETPLIHEKKEETMARILETHDISVYEDSWSCYNGGLGEYNGVQCGRCPACVERQIAFYANGVKDPLPYVNPLTKKEIDAIIKG
jgi:7-cyano-7-deazaguanine synthase